jgi:hypothetical protein
VQFLARMYKVKENRERSRDDIDFMSAADNKGIEEFKKYLSGEKFVPFIEENNGFQLGYSNKKAGVEVNALLTYDSEFEGQTEQVDLTDRNIMMKFLCYFGNRCTCLRPRCSVCQLQIQDARRMVQI